MTDMEEKRYDLLPCPFCGGVAAMGGCMSAFAYCTRCGAHSVSCYGAGDEGRQRAAIRWNRRAGDGVVSAEERLQMMAAEGNQNAAIGSVRL